MYSLKTSVFNAFHLFKKSSLHPRHRQASQSLQGHEGEAVLEGGGRAGKGRRGGTRGPVGLAAAAHPSVVRLGPAAGPGSLAAGMPTGP